MQRTGLGVSAAKSPHSASTHAATILWIPQVEVRYGANMLVTSTKFCKKRVSSVRRRERVIKYVEPPVDMLSPTSPMLCTLTLAPRYGILWLLDPNNNPLAWETHS